MTMSNVMMKLIKTATPSTLTPLRHRKSLISTFKPIPDQNEVYSDCYARLFINFYAFNTNGNRGVACGLGNIQKIRNGEPLGGYAIDDFTVIDDDSNDDFLA